VLFANWYSNGIEIPTDPGEAKKYWEKKLADAMKFASTDHLLFMNGCDHQPVQTDLTDALKTAAKLYPGSHVAAAWSAQDCITSDGIPFIGIYTSDRPNWYVATGFQKWGMSSSMVSALILKDLICNRENPFADVFSPSRFSAEEIPHIVKDGKKAVAGLTRRFFQIPDETISSLERGQGAVVTTSEGKVGVYKTEEGEIRQVDIVCPHMGCQLSWNPDEQSWDCPCHGSRFDVEGNLLDDPAQEGIQCSGIQE